MQLFLCSAFFSFSPSMTRRQKFYFLPRLRNQENGVLQGNKVSYSIESWKWGIFRQRQLFCNRKISSVLGCPAFSTGFPHSTVCSPSGRGGHFCPSTSLAAYFRAKMPTPALMAAYCFMRKTSSSCRATNYIQFFSLLQSFFSVYIHHISVILLNKWTLLKAIQSPLNLFLLQAVPHMLTLFLSFDGFCQVADVFSGSGLLEYFGKLLGISEKRSFIQ